VLRKAIVIWLFFAMLFASITASATRNVPSDDNVEEYIGAEEGQAIAIEGSVEDVHRNGADETVRTGKLSVPETSDLVTVESDGAISIATEDGIVMTVYPPFGMVAFTQDLSEQLNTYAMLDDPVGVIDTLKEMGIHVYMVDLVSEAEVYVSTSSNIVSWFVYDLDELSEGDLNELISSISKLEPNALVSVQTHGAHRFLVYDYRSSGSQVIIYTGIKNNTNINFQYTCNAGEIGDQELQDIEYLLSGVRLAEM